MSSESSASTNSSASGWGAGYPWLSVMGVHMTVLGGWPVWPLALHQLLVTEDCLAFLDQCLEGVDFFAVPVGPWSFGERVLEDVVSGGDLGWAGRRVPL